MDHTHNLASNLANQSDRHKHLTEMRKGSVPGVAGQENDKRWVGESKEMCL